MTVRFTVERDMTASVPEFLRGLPAAVAAAFGALGCGEAECRAAAAQAGSAAPAAADDTQTCHVVVEQSGRRLEIALTPQAARDIGALRLPRTRAALTLSGVSDSEAGRFLEAFDARFRRGGG